MTTLASSHLRNRVHREIGELLDQLPEHEQFYVLLRHPLRMNPDAIPLKPDGRRMTRPGDAWRFGRIDKPRRNPDRQPPARRTHRAGPSD
jgi:hypothetical protein